MSSAAAGRQGHLGKQRAETRRRFSNRSLFAPHPAIPFSGMLIFERFGEELPYLLLRRCQSLVSGLRCPIRSASPAPLALLPRPKQAAHLQSMQHGIDGTCAEPVAVPAQLFDHAQTKDRLLAGMVQNVQANEP